MIICKIHGKTLTYDSFCKTYDSRGFETNIFKRECRKCRKVELDKEFKTKELKNFIKEWKD